MQPRKIILLSICFLISTPAVIAHSYTTSIVQNSDDGTEVNGCFWFEEGVDSSDNYLGRGSSKKYETGFRFHLDGLDQGDEITYARLRFAASGSHVTSSVSLCIEGVLQESPSTFSQTERPSQKTPKTRQKVLWTIGGAWGEGSEEVPLYCSSPDISPIINEILSLSNWGTGPEGKTLILTIRDESDPSEINYVKFDDYDKSDAGKKSPVLLEIYRTAYDAFLGRELLGRVTDSSALVNLYSLVDVDAYVEYGTSPGRYEYGTPPVAGHPAGTPLEISIENLSPDRRYYYRLAYRKAGDLKYKKGEKRTFHTQRTKGSPFSFAVLADEHLQDIYKLPQKIDRMELYRITLQNIAGGGGDFFLSLGDFAHTDFHGGRKAENFQEALERYLLQREYIDDVAHSLPFYLVIGNHEGEQGWFYCSGGESARNLAFISLAARKEIIPNPYPGAFYSGNPDDIPLGIREDYFAWEWGDALFVVLAPFWYTKVKPKLTQDGWDWTLGKAQYDWLHETLHGSTAKWKLVFIHHLTSTVAEKLNYNTFYGRGGIEVAKHKVDGRPSFEWGGEDKDGNYIFGQERPGWAHRAVHDMLVSENVNILFHGHDHFFAKQDLDNIVYLECPQPDQSKYNYGFMDKGKYKHGDFLPNSGHVQVTVDPGFIQVDYIRAYLPGDGVNGEIAYSFMIK